MRITGTAAFMNWLSANNRYPFNEISKTRTSFHCKWVLLKSSTRQALETRAVRTEYNAVLSSSFPRDLLEQLIISGAATPVIPDYDYIIDDMVVWGHGNRYEWYCDVLDYLAYVLHHCYARNRKWVIRDCILYQVEYLLNGPNGIAINSPVMAFDISHMWQNDFIDNIYHVSLEFQTMVVISQQYVALKVVQLSTPPPIVAIVSPTAEEVISE
jgi:hypothetical protein